MLPCSCVQILHTMFLSVDVDVSVAGGGVIDGVMERDPLFLVCCNSFHSGKCDITSRVDCEGTCKL